MLSGRSRKVIGAFFYSTFSGTLRLPCLRMRLEDFRPHCHLKKKKQQAVGGLSMTSPLSDDMCAHVYCLELRRFSRLQHTKYGVLQPLAACTRRVLLVVMVTVLLV